MHLLSDDEYEKKRRITDMLMKDFENVAPYVEKILRYAVQHRPVFLVIDNVDQFEKEGKQAEVFSNAMAIAHRLGLNIVLALREQTYVKQKTQPIFDAFDCDPIYIDPPEVLPVLSRRFFVSRELLRGREVSFVAENGATVHLSDAAVIIDLVQGSVLGTGVGRLIDVLATSDIRLALRMTREFLQYGYTATGRALEIFQNTGKYILPQHEALRAIMFGNQGVYSDEYSSLGNIFDAKLGRTTAQMLRLFILSAMVNYNSSAVAEYMEGEEVARQLRSLGFGDDTTLRVLKDLCRHRFAFTASHTEPSLQSSFFPTRLGGYVTRVLMAELAFLENTMMDTFVADEEIWRQLKGLTDLVYEERDIMPRLRLRKQRAEIFFEFVKEMYTPLRNEAGRRGLPAEWCGHPIEAIEPQFREGLRYAMRSASRNYPETPGIGSEHR